MGLRCHLEVVLMTGGIVPTWTRSEKLGGWCLTIINLLELMGTFKETLKKAKERKRESGGRSPRRTFITW